MNNDLISREALKKALHNFFNGKVIDEPAYILRDVFCHIDNAPTVELTEEHAIDKLHETGWIIRHDKEMTERPQGEWIVTAEDNNGVHRICCPFCRYEKGSNNTDHIVVTFTNFPRFCENCGADMQKGGKAKHDKEEV